MKSNLAIFDVDGTLIKENIGITFVKYLIKKKQVKRVPYFIIALLYALYKLRIIDFKWAIKIGAWALQGNKLVELERLATECMNESIVNKISQEGVNEIAALKSQGWRVIIATGAHEIIARQFALAVGADDYVATKSEFRNGVATYTISEPIPYKKGKADLVLQYAKAHDIETIGRVYTDEKKDIPLLRIAEIPIGVNADEQVTNYVMQNNRGQIMTFDLP